MGPRVCDVHGKYAVCVFVEATGRAGKPVIKIVAGITSSRMSGSEMERKALRALITLV